MQHRMRLTALSILLMLTASSAAVSAPIPQKLAGAIGIDQRYGSGYLDLKPMVTFHAGDRLRIHVGGSAAKVVVRLLPKGASPDSPSIIIREAQIVPPGRIFEVVLDQDYPDIVQISVHGGSDPWNLYPLGAGNGAAELLSVERSR